MIIEHRWVCERHSIGGNLTCGMWEAVSKSQIFLERHGAALPIGAIESFPGNAPSARIVLLDG